MARRQQPRRSAVCVAAITDAMDGDDIFRLIEDHAVVADAETEQPFELAAERLNPAGACSSVTMNRFQHMQSGVLLNGADFFRNLRVKPNLLHVDGYSPWRT